MNYWKEYKLGDAPIKFIDGDRGKNYPSQGEFFSKGHCLFLSTKNVRQEGFDFTECSFITLEKDLSLRKGKLQKNDIILTTRGTIGNLAFFDDKVPFNNVRINSGMLIIRPNEEEVTARYCFYIFRSLQNTFITFTSGSAQPQLPIRDLNEIDILLPPLPEQRAIASVLSSLDDKIDLLHRQNATLEALAETLFRQWFVEEAEESWEETELIQHIEVFRGLSYKGSGLTDESDGVPMHNLNSVLEGGGYKYQGIKYYKGEFKDRHIVEAGDIIVTNTEQGHELKLIGFPAIVPSYFGDFGIFSQHIYKVKLLKESYLTTPFVYYLLMTPKVREQITGATNGSTVNMLAIDGLQRPTFKLPPKTKVAIFTNMVKQYWQKKENNHTQIRTLTQLRDTLLPKLMSGEVRVSEISNQA